ncbi:MAG: SBBP repeat-containing protein [Candidatus Aminicenantes bacterium]|nr:SBBP repeat-containing protein [Candidatus Aminicenantes bacterium]
MKKPGPKQNKKLWLLLSISLVFLINTQADQSWTLTNKKLFWQYQDIPRPTLIKETPSKRINDFSSKIFLKKETSYLGLTNGTVYFMANKGQLSSEVDFYFQDKGRAIFFSSEGISFLLPGHNWPWVVKLKFIGCQEEIKPIQLGRAQVNFSFFKGSEENWRVEVPGYEAICYPDLWPGIDLIYSSSEGGIKSEFVIKAGADPKKIRFAVEGADKIDINEKGELVIQTPEGSIIDKTPVAYQKKGNKIIDIDVNYEIYNQSTVYSKNNQSTFLPILGFSIGAYDRTQDLIVDPVTLVGGTFLGGPAFDYAYGVALDASGFVYLTGYTYSVSGFPLTAGPQLGFNGGDVDAYIIKIDPKNSRIVYCGYLGGADRDYAYDVAVDPEGAAYLVGYTASKEGTFPVINGPDLTHNGQYDVFVAKINSTGTRLEFCGFLGGERNDFGRGIAVDLEGRAYITGYTESNEFSFPVKKGPILSFKKNYDAFIARISSSGKEIEYCGYLGGNGNDWGYGLVVDSEGATYIAGATTSDEYSFPVTVGPDLTFNGQVDAFVAKVSPSGEEIIYCGYIGGDGEDAALAIDLDDQGLAYIAGYTGSTEKTFPVTFGPDLDYNGGFYDAFVARISFDGRYLTYCGYIGGSGYDVAFGLSVDSHRCAYITGFTSSDQESFPIKDGPELTFFGSFDGFLAKINFSGTRIVFCGYLGGSEADYGQDVVVNKNGSGNIYLAGSTYSNNFSFPLKSGFSRSFQGKRDAFLAHFYEETIMVTSPNGGEIWYSGLEKDITWFSVGEVGPVRIELSTDNGQTWQVIIEETENDGLFTWIVPEISSSTCLIRISEAVDGVPSDTSDYIFFILNEPVIVITSPNGGEEWPVGSIQEIKWITGSAPVGEVKIEYSTNKGKNWIEIIDRTENDGLFEWEIPDTPSSECLVRISEAEDGSPADLSDATFTIYSPQSPPLKPVKADKKDKISSAAVERIENERKKSIRNLSSGGTR